MTKHHHHKGGKKKDCKCKGKKPCDCNEKKKGHHKKRGPAKAGTYFAFIKGVYAKPSKYPKVYAQIKDVMPVTKRAPILSKAYRAEKKTSE